MILQQKTLEKLGLLINEETEKRSGPKLVAFFNDLGFRDNYGKGFPTRSVFTYEKLVKINGTPELDTCIKKVFAPVNFIGRFSQLDNLLKDFNQYLNFDGWAVVRKEKEITFEKAGKLTFEDKTTEIKEDYFLKREFKDISLENLGLDGVVTEILKQRFDEIHKCFNAKASLSVIFMAGSTLEGILLGVALNYPREFNQSVSSPKDKEGKVKPFQAWTLSNLIDVASDTGILKEDVRKFSHALRDFRNYIHPFEQISSRFNPDERTAKICLQVLNAAIYQLTNNKI